MRTIHDIYIYIYILKRIKEKIFIILYFEGGEWVTRASLYSPS